MGLPAASRRGVITTRVVNCSPFFPPAQKRPFPFALLKCRSHDLQGYASLDILRGVQNRGIGLSDDFLGLVAVEAPRALIPKQDLSREVLGDHRVFARGFENIGNEVDGFLCGTDDRAVKKLGFLVDNNVCGPVCAIHVRCSSLS
jgi:hypothetical protein